MRIVLTEVRGEQRLATYKFNQAIIKIGRDPAKCDIVFEQQKWLMVSRVHAELRLQDGLYYVVDLNSRQGTFLNGAPVVKPTPVHVGSRIQFGETGPVLVVDPELDPAATNVMETPMLPESAKLATPQRAVTAPTTSGLQPKTPSQRSAPILLLESGSAAKGESRFVLTSDVTVLGRDAVADIQVDAAAPVVSRRHAEIRRQADGKYLISDLQSFNGTLVNGQRISHPTLLKDGDQVQLSVGGPILRFIDLAAPLSTGQTSIKPTGAAKVSAPPDGKPGLARESSPPEDFGSRTIVARAGVAQGAWAGNQERAAAQLVQQHAFGAKGRISVGRDPDNDIQLDALVISNHHARFINTAQGVVVEDAGSTNGVYLNGTRVSGWHPVLSGDVVQIGPFVLSADLVNGVAVFDTRSQTRVDAVEITDIISRGAGGQAKLLDNISLAIEPNEFVGLLGPSGAGKSLLMNALNGMRRTSGGRVLINNLDLYQHLHSLKQAIGHVPQDDIIHRELTVYRTLYYVARLRLSRDVRPDEIDQIINEVMEVTGLSERRDVEISQLSGGQRKRVSIAVELITKPSIIFLDEPTSGLDPGTEERIMKLFRQIAESGRTVILTTHAMENVYLFDKVALLMRGRLIFYGTPNEALAFVGVDNFIDLYNKLEQPLDAELNKLSTPPPNATKAQKHEYDGQRNRIAETVADEWRSKFLRTDSYRRNISIPIARVQQGGPAIPTAYRRPGIIDSIRQWGTLVRRYAQVLLSDKLNLAILFGQAPIIALLTYLVVSQDDPRDFPYFVLALVPVWFGTSVAAREIVKERTIYKRERMVNLGLLPYVGSKLFALSCIVTLQCFMLFATLKLLHFAELMYLPGFLGGLGQLLVMILTGVVGIALGLFISALVRTSEIATSIVPLLLIPQILFCGLVGVPMGVSRVVGTVMPATWSFDEMKQLSTLDTLKQEGSSPTGQNRGRGLYKHIEDLNNKKMADARENIEAQRQETEKNLKDYERKIKEYVGTVATGRAGPAGRAAALSSPPAAPTLKPAPVIPDVENISDDLSHYVSFKHPWGGIVIDFAVLVVMFFALLFMTLIALRTQDPD